MPAEEAPEQPQENAAEPQLAAAEPQPAAAEAQLASATPQPDVVELSREQLEDLRRRLQKRFH